MNRTAALAYGSFAYLLFLAVFVWAMLWLAAVPDLPVRSIDQGAVGPTVTSLIVDALLLGLFAVPHSVMARPGFKQWITRFISPVIERSTYVLVSSVLLAVVLIGWQSVPTPVWTLEGPAAAALWTTFVIGWLVVLSSTFAISHADLFGLRQVYLFWRGSKDHELPFLIRGLYRVVRHPLMLGFIVAFWSAPVMSIGHLLFAVMTTLYILVALQFEERDLLRAFGERYRDYQRRVPMLLPRLMR